MKLFYRVPPGRHREAMDRIRDELNLHEEVDEDRIILLAETEDRVIKVTCSYDPRSDDEAYIKVILADDTLEEFFRSVFGEPFRKKG